MTKATSSKHVLRRSGNNARGFFDDELTKRRRDWKEALDFGVPGSRDWSLPDDDSANACLDGFNLFPKVSEAPRFRSVMREYFEELTALSERLAASMAQGLGMRPECVRACACMHGHSCTWPHACEHACSHACIH